MDSTMFKLRSHIDAIVTYLTPLLPLANCHMVEFLTEKHWERLLPRGLRETLDGMEMDTAVELFWSSCENNDCDKSELSRWVHAARSHCLAVNNQYCLSVGQFENRIKSWGGEMQPEIRVKDFMSSKKSYEVSTMSRLLSSLYHATGASCSVEAGGGRGHLFAAATLAYRLRCLTVDCDANTLASAEERGKVIQKQWHAIAKQVEDGREQNVPKPVGEGLHRFAKLFVTEDTDLAAVVKEKFPELEHDDARILLTGLHTCGNLGPSSLRIFASQPSTCAVLNVPCCYHLLTEELDSSLFDVFQINYGGEGERRGFPMSEHLRGYNLGRNARMLAAQSIDRVVAQRQLPAKSLLHRALLQELIKKHKPDFVLAEGRLKRVAAKTQDFVQYFKMADSILNLELFESLPASAMGNVDCQWKKMVLFYLIRLCLAQVVESLILLDRLLFLRENGYNNVFLVKLFDPVLSPRCHCIVAVK
ncbi:probable methyltransferase-like protein 25 [Choristoneura fumiferana]|uniref:probable methyltransferase-like protein 25 n=1 Tax=Choristoneura fumiferana TaxID=7141 RepID=UPI003D153BA5